MANTAANVSTGKPKVGGAVYAGETSATLPTDAVSTFTGFTCLGYCSEDGVTNTTEIESDEIKAWGGDTVLTLEDGKSDTFQFTLIESMNADVLKEVYGADNVSGSALATGISVAVNVGEHKARAWVIDMILKGNILKRIVIPKGTITAIGEIQYRDDTPIGYAVTVTAQIDSSGNYHYEYLQNASSSGT